MTTVWILVTNASEGRIFVSPKAKLFNGEASLALIGEYENPDSRKKSGDIASDKLGHFRGKNEGHGDFVEATSPQEYKAIQFAKQLADVLDDGRISNAYQELILVASPHFQGLLTKEINHQIDSMIIQNIKKDYTKDTEKQLMEHLSTFL